MEHDRKMFWIAAYLTALHAMLPLPDEIGGENSRIPDDAKAIADRAVKHFDTYMLETHTPKDR